jgi:hypothetical protein
MSAKGPWKKTTNVKNYLGRLNAKKNLKNVKEIKT